MPTGTRLSFRNERTPSGEARFGFPMAHGGDEAYGGIAEARAPARFDSALRVPALTQADAAFAADAVSPDYRHLLPATRSTSTFSFSAAQLEQLCTLNRFPIPTGAERVLFGLRGCTLPGAGLSSGWAASVDLVEALPNHNDARCVLGVWDRPGGRLMVFKGSTVPFWSSMENYRQGGERCNMLSTGLYGYSVGTHRSGHRLEIKGALRQRGSAVVLRTVDDLIYQVTDPWDSGAVGDNIHPARHSGTTPFSSEGCHTLPGTYDRAAETHAGAWTDFRRAAGLTPTTAPSSEDGRRFTYVCLTGREARLVGSVASPARALARLRFGSQGVDVRALQLGLRSTGHYAGSVSGVMDVATTLAYIEWQKATGGGVADAIVTPEKGRMLGFDMITQQSIAPTRPGAAAPFGRASAYGSPRFVLTGSVGDGGDNAAADVAALKDRLIGLGYDWVTAGTTIDAATTRAIKLFQSIVAGRNVLRGDGRVDVPGTTYAWLQAENAPRWQTMPAGSPAEGFHNAELADTHDHHDYGTDWMAATICSAAAHYRDHYLAAHPAAALLTVNDVSLPRGGDTPDHEGHETGLACDLRLPRLDGTAPGNTKYTDTAVYDRAAARGLLEALRAQPLVSRVYFNDPVLIGEGLCARLGGHDNHIHFQLTPPARGAAESLSLAFRAERAFAGRAAVVIDPGHGGAAALGGSTPIGVRGPRGTREKDVTLALGRRLSACLGDGAVLTRDGDENVPLAERARVASRSGASVFLSLHANGGAPGQQGSEVWIHGRAGHASRGLAGVVSRALRDAGAGEVRIMAGPLAVLDPRGHAAETAACLVEIDYLSHPDGERRLGDERHLDALADALAAAVRSFLG